MVTIDVVAKETVVAVATGFKMADGVVVLAVLGWA